MTTAVIEMIRLMLFGLNAYFMNMFNSVILRLFIQSNIYLPKKYYQ